MGNICCKVDSSVQCLYNSYYPKHKYLQPLYVTSVGMIGLVGGQLLVKEAVKETARDNFYFLTSLSALYGSQAFFLFFTGKTLHDAIPRVEYARAESALQPKYTFLTTVLSGVAAFYYLKRYPFSTWNDKNCTFAWAVLGSFAMNILNSTCFTQQTLHLYNSMIEIETKAGVSRDLVGYVPAGNQYLQMND